MFQEFILLLSLLVSSLTTPGFSHAATVQEIYLQVDRDIIASDRFVESLDQYYYDASKEEVFMYELSLLFQHLETSIPYYENSLDQDADQELVAAINQLVQAEIGMQNTLGRMEDVVANGTYAEFDLEIDKYNAYIDQFNSGISQLDGYSGAVNYSWLFIPFVLSFFVSLYLFIISRGSPILPSEKMRNQFELSLFKSSLWPFLASTVSYFWYLLTPSGDSFYWFPWVMLLGYIQFIRGLYVYLRRHRPALNAQRVVEMQKLEGVLGTDIGQKTQMSEDAAKIAGLSPVIDLTKNNKDKTEPEDGSKESEQSSSEDSNDEAENN